MHVRSAVAGVEAVRREGVIINCIVCGVYAVAEEEIEIQS